MKRYIARVLSKYKPFITAKEEYIQSYLNYYRIVFLGKDCRYFKLELFFNENLIIGEGTYNGDDLLCKIESNIKDIGTYDECKSELELVRDKDYVSSFIRNYIERLKISTLNEIKGYNISLIDLRIIMEPVGIILLNYKYNNIYKSPMLLLLGVDNKPSNTLSEEEVNLFNSINNKIKEVLL